MRRSILVWMAIAVVAIFTASNVATAKQNRLAKEASPYLRQHADNPVDWYPWVEEAFVRARRENKPILLSIGYSTCLWCHQMLVESYSNQQIADILNKYFVAIKVDRERRPDVDETYMLSTQLINQAGGWPNNVFLTPDLKPFHGGIYFPPDVFSGLLTEVANRWASDQSAIVGQANQIADMIAQVMSHRVAAKELTPAFFETVAKQMVSGFDPVNGGARGPSKSPNETALLFLLDRWELAGDKAALTAATRTLDGMIKGGIRDQVGGGFHRYATDPQWRQPNFEMMLYNQAGIARALLQAYRITGYPRYRDSARGLLDFVLRDMTAPNGGFYTSLDPEMARDGSKSEDGLHYTWLDDELAAALGPDDNAFALRVFGKAIAPQFKGRYVLHIATSAEAIAKTEKQTVADVYRRLAHIRKKLRTARKQRKAPRRDEKILTAWNGAMILALSEAAAVFGDERYEAAALKAATFFWQDLGGAAGQLKRYSFDGRAELAATQPDYAFMSLGYLALYDATADTVWLERAKKLAADMHTKFHDPDANDYFLSEVGGFFRPKMLSDTEQPSGNAVAIELFARLARRELDLQYRNYADQLLASMSGAAQENPGENMYAVRAAQQHLRGEVGPVRMIAKGRVRVLATKKSASDLIKVRISIAPGWHINGHKPLEEFFVPTVLKVAGDGQADTISLPKVVYPPAKRLKLGFHVKELALYEGDVELTIQAAKVKDSAAVLEFTAQTCSNEVCLNPETVRLSVLPRQ
ncbi:MAG: hypothetical protein ACI89J_002935 [Hyphomicrobiaceae bacterium]|jgi:uncharacterized protein YyaL (SSP411 family)